MSDTTSFSRKLLLFWKKSFCPLIEHNASKSHNKRYKQNRSLRFIQLRLEYTYHPRSLLFQHFNFLLMHFSFFMTLNVSFQSLIFTFHTFFCKCLFVFRILREKIMRIWGMKAGQYLVWYLSPDLITKDNNQSNLKQH